MTQQNVGNQACGHRHQDVICTHLYPLMASGRGLEVVMPVIDHHVLRAAQGAGQVVATAEFGPARAVVVAWTPAVVIALVAAVVSVTSVVAPVFPAFSALFPAVAAVIAPVRLAVVSPVQALVMPGFAAFRIGIQKSEDELAEPAQELGTTGDDSSQNDSSQIQELPAQKAIADNNIDRRDNEDSE